MTRLLAVAAALLVSFGSATAAEPLKATDFSAFDQRLTALEKRVADLEAKQATFRPFAPAPVSTLVKSTSVARQPVGHTHTCANGHTWDHSVTPGHNCPECGLPQYVQDPTPRTVTAGTPGWHAPAPFAAYQPPPAGQPFGAYSITGGNGYFGAGGCANGQCDTGGGGSERRGLFGRLRGR
jgi:hypothetical protein